VMPPTQGRFIPWQITKYTTLALPAQELPEENNATFYVTAHPTHVLRSQTQAARGPGPPDQSFDGPGGTLRMSPNGPESERPREPHDSKRCDRSPSPRCPVPGRVIERLSGHPPVCTQMGRHPSSGSGQRRGLPLPFTCLSVATNL